MISLRSKLTQRLLSYLFLHKDEAFYINELARQLRVDDGNLTRKLHELSGKGVLKAESKGNLTYFRLNPQFPLLGEYERIVQRTIGLEATLREMLTAVQGIHQAYIYGSYAANQLESTSDIDLLAVGDHNSLALQKRLTPLQKQIGREINCTSMTDKEFKRRRSSDSFLRAVFSKPTIQLV